MRGKIDIQLLTVLTAGSASAAFVIVIMLAAVLATVLAAVVAPRSTQLS